MTREELEDYVPGRHCICYAKYPGECCCGVDWTPKEVYSLRLDVEELKCVVCKACTCLQSLDVAPSLEMQKLCNWRPRATPKVKQIRMTCSACGSDQIVADANATWDTLKQEWVLDAVCDSVTCAACDSVGKPKESVIDED